jgi:voltage-gated potassium channel Kch
MHVLAGVVAIALIAIILGDAFETVILPRRIRRRFRYASLFYRYTWLAWRVAFGKVHKLRRRETLLGFFGPLSLIILFLSWAILLIVGFALLHWALGGHFAGSMAPGFSEALYFSGTTFTTLGLGDVQPASSVGRALAVLEAGTGFGFLAIVIGYLPVIYQAFSRRETSISRLDARAGSPPSAVEMLRRYAELRALTQLDLLLHEFDLWSAELLESHISYPVLALFRSQHNNESWISALTTILDVCALLTIGVEGAHSCQARLTFAMARHAAVDLAQVLHTPPSSPPQDRLPDADVERLRRTLASYGAKLREGPAADAELLELRRMYEPYVYSLAKHLLLTLPPWFPQEGAYDNWQTSAWERAARRLPPAETAVPDDHL